VQANTTALTGITTNITTRSGFIDPADVHFHRTQTVLQKRQAVLQAAYEKGGTFVKVPDPASIAPAWINPPQHTPAQSENENSRCNSAVPVSLGAEIILPELRLPTSIRF
jgi:hypothetical protein